MISSWDLPEMLSIMIIIMTYAGPYGGNIGRMPDADRRELKGGQSI